MLLTKEGSALALAHAYVSGAHFVLSQEIQADWNAGHGLFASHVSDAKALLKVAIEGSNPDVTYQRMIGHFRQLSRSMSPEANDFALRVLQILEAGR